MEQMLETYMEQIINTYYANNAKKLHTVINQIFVKHYGGILGKDIEEFYGIGSDVIMDIVWNRRYDSSKGDFDGYIYRAILFAIKDEYKRRYRDKRVFKVEGIDDKGNKIKIPIADVSLDAPIKEGENITIGDTLQSDFTMDSALFGIMGCKEEYSPEMKEYLGKLSKIQVKVLELIADNYTPEEIKTTLHIDSKLYADCIAAIRAYKNIKCIAGLVRRNEKC
jgi:hypothetical protein